MHVSARVSLAAAWCGKWKSLPHALRVYAQTRLKIAIYSRLGWPIGQQRWLTKDLYATARHLAQMQTTFAWGSRLWIDWRAVIITLLIFIYSLNLCASLMDVYRAIVQTSNSTAMMVLPFVAICTIGKLNAMRWRSWHKKHYFREHVLWQ